MYGQIVRWFQNHNYLDRKSLDGSATKKKKRSVSSDSQIGDDDDEAIQSHLSELQKEVKKNRYDEPD